MNTAGAIVRPRKRLGITDASATGRPATPFTSAPTSTPTASTITATAGVRSGVSGLQDHRLHPFLLRRPGGDTVPMSPLTCVTSSASALFAGGNTVLAHCASTFERTDGRRRSFWQRHERGSGFTLRARSFGGADRLIARQRERCCVQKRRPEEEIHPLPRSGLCRTT